MKKLLAIILITLFFSLTNLVSAVENITSNESVLSPNTSDTWTTSNEDNEEEQDDNNEEDGDEVVNDDNVYKGTPNDRAINTHDGKTRSLLEPHRVNTIRKEFNWDMKQIRADRNEILKNNKIEMRDNREYFRKENREDIKQVFSWLSEDTKKGLKDTHVELQADIKELHEEYQDKLKDEEGREELKIKLEELQNKYHKKVNELVWDNTEAMEILNKRKNVYQANQEIRKDSYMARKEFRGERSKIVAKYKWKFLERLWKVLDKASTSKLEKISAKIDWLIERFESNSKLSDKRKDKIISQLIALKEIIDEKLEENDAEMEDLDLESILDVD